VRGWLWEDGGLTDLGNLPGCCDYQSYALGLSEPGQVVGRSQTLDYSIYHAFLWQAGGMQDLGTLPGHLQSQADDINDAGEIVGSSQDASGSRAVLWTADYDSAPAFTIVDLGTLPGDTYSTGVKLNDARQVIGWSVRDSSDFGSPGARSFLWDNGVTTDLGDGGAYADPYSPRTMRVTGLNNKGQIIGWSDSIELQAFDKRAWLWENGLFRDLTNTSGCVAVEESIANDINDAGQIAA